MAIALSKSNDEIQHLPLVELAWEILKTKKEPLYFRDLMNEVQALRNMTDEAVMDVIARLYTEINIDGRFFCIGQNVWGLKRWYPVDKVADKGTGKRFVRKSGDAFSDDDEDIDEDFDDVVVDDVEDVALFTADDDDDAAAEEEEEGFIVDEETEFDEADDAEAELEEPLDEEADEEEADEDEPF